MTSESNALSDPERAPGPAYVSRTIRVWQRSFPSISVFPECVTLIFGLKAFVAAVSG